MKKVWIAIVILLAVLAAMQGFYLLLRRAHNARQSEPAVTSAPAPIAEATPEIKKNQAPKVAELEIVEPQPLREPGERMQQYEDIPADKLVEIAERRKETMGALYAKRFNMTEEEWNALTPKEQRHLIRKGTK